MGKKRRILGAVIVGILSIIAAIFVLRFSFNYIDVPYAYSTDALDVLAEAQSAIRGDGIWTNEGMAAPYKKVLYNLRQGSWIDIVLIRGIAICVKEAGTSINIYYLLSFAMIGISCYLTLSCLNISKFIAIFCGIIYSCMPFHFIIGEYMISLSSYYMVPPACLVIYWTLYGEIYEGGKFCKKKLKITLFIISLLAINNIYYTAFFAMLLFFSILYSAFSAASLRRMLKGFLLEIYLGLCLILEYIPSFIYNFISNEKIENFAGRTLRDLDIYGLKMSLLFLPIQGHRIDFLNNIRNTYNSYVGLNENSSSSLGFVMSCGVILSIFLCFFQCRKVPNRDRIEVLGKANLFVILLGISGGLNVFVGLFITCSIRCYNRLSVFIGMFGIMVVAYILDYITNMYLSRWIKTEAKRIILLNLIMMVVTICAILDQTTVLYAQILLPDWNDYSKYYATREEAILEYRSDKKYIAQIENEMEEGDMIFELPIIAGTTEQNFPNRNPNGYDLLKPYIHSMKLKWSFGDKIGGKTDQWLVSIQGYSIDMILKEICNKGFKGLYIDARGYDEKEFTKIADFLKNQTGVSPIIDEKKGIYFYNLTSYIKDNMKQTDICSFN